MWSSQGVCVKEPTKEREWEKRLISPQLERNSSWERLSVTNFFFLRLRHISAVHLYISFFKLRKCRRDWRMRLAAVLVLIFSRLISSF